MKQPKPEALKLLTVATYYTAILSDVGFAVITQTLTPKGIYYAKEMLANGYKPTDEEMGTYVNYLISSGKIAKDQADAFLALLIEINTLGVDDFLIKVDEFKNNL